MFFSLENHIMSEFKKIIHSDKFANSHPYTPTQEDLFKALFESPGAVKTRSILVEVGQTIGPSKTKINFNLTNATGLVQILEAVGR